jgi:sugar O-acyltransferase (sialic acid O-acetyltransferase NeuD family)
MKRDLYIVGAGGFGREVFAWLMELPGAGQEWVFKGFLDDNLAALDGFTYPIGVVSSVTGFKPGPNDSFVCGIGSVGAKRHACAPLIGAGAHFLTVVHPTAVMGPNVILGDGVVLCPRVTLTCDIEVGAMAMINCHSTVGHDAKVGAWSTMSAHCDLTGHTSLGEGAFLGSGARVIPNKSVGSGAMVGAGSVVIKSVPEGVKVFGNPAREIG